MLEEELWLSRVSDKANMDIDVFNRIFCNILSYFERVLSQGKCVFFFNKIIIKTVVEKEFVAKISDKYFLCPPSISMKVERIEGDSITLINAIPLFDIRVLSELSSIDSSLIGLWVEAFNEVVSQDLHCGKIVNIKDVMTIMPIMEDEALQGCKISLNDKLYNRLNKPFSSFKKIEILGYDYEAFMLEEKEFQEFEDIDKNKRLCFFYLFDEKNRDEDKESQDVLTIITDKKDSKIEESSKEISQGDESEIGKESNVMELVSQEVIERDKIESIKEATETDKKKWYLLFVVILVFVCVFLYLMFFHKKEVKKGNKTIGVKVVSYEKNKEKVKEEIPSQIDSNDIIRKSSENTNAVTSLIIDRRETIDTVYIKSGDRLTLYALKKYGKKVFWVYIYQENRDVISNPDGISIGTRIILPPASKYNIDSKDNNSINKALILEKELTKNRK